MIQTASAALALATFYMLGFLGSFPVLRFHVINATAAGASVPQTLLVYDGLNVWNLLMAGLVSLGIAVIATYGGMAIAKNVRWLRRHPVLEEVRRQLDAQETRAR